MRVAIAVGVLMLSCQAVFAAAYDDFAQGVAANAQDDSELAIKSFSAAIAAPDLNPSLLLQAYRGRAEAFLHEDKCRAALSDLDQAFRINATDLATLGLRAHARVCDGDLPGGEAAFGEAIAVKPVPAFYFERGRVRFRQQNYSGAAEDFAIYAPVKSKRPYGILWLEMARRRGLSLDPKVVADDIDHLDSDDWPAPLLSLYAGKATLDAVLAVVKDGPEQHKCEANFYGAEWLLGGKDMDAARSLLQKVVADCPHDSVEFSEAHFELGQTK